MAAALAYARAHLAAGAAPTRLGPPLRVPRAPLTEEADDAEGAGSAHEPACYAFEGHEFEGHELARDVDKFFEGELAPEVAGDQGDGGAEMLVDADAPPPDAPPPGAGTKRAASSVSGLELPATSRACTDVAAEAAAATGPRPAEVQVDEAGRALSAVS